MTSMNEDTEYTVTLTGHQWLLIIEQLGDHSDGEDHLHGLMTEVSRQTEGQR
jgi:hypothetical protein